MTRSKKKTQDKYRFALVLTNLTESDDLVEDALFEAGCGDAMLVLRDGVTYLEFDREGDDFESSILSAVSDAESTDYCLTVAHVEPDDVVNASEIARRLQWSREYVRLLARGSRGEGGFPSPLSGVTGKTRLWSWSAVLRWLKEDDRLEDNSLLADAETIRDINGALSLRSHPDAAMRRRRLLRKLRSSGA